MKYGTISLNTYAPGRFMYKKGRILMTEFISKYAEGFIETCDLSDIKEETLNARDTLITGKGPGSDFTGWVDLPEKYDREEFVRIKKAAQKIRNDSEVLIVAGIGGSYLGARAAIELLKKCGDGPDIYFAGCSLSPDDIQKVIEFTGDRDFSVNVISKSGTTTETAIAFRILREMTEKKYGKEEASKRIYATTDKERGVLKTLASAEGYEQFTVPDDVGGRYSVLTAVGLLPIAAAGIDIDMLMKGAQDMREHALKEEYEKNGPLQYAAIRNILYRKGKKIELLTDFDSSLHYVAEWWKQLFGESEGKDRKGIFPAAADFSTDLHSMGQYIQDGERILMETVLDIKKSPCCVKVGEIEGNADGLNFLSGISLDEINHEAMKGTILAHNDGGVPVMKVEIPEKNAYYLGQLFYFFEFACGVSGYLLNVNPFNQPGVESYKKNMFALLGKPGYEEEGKKLKERL